MPPETPPGSQNPGTPDEGSQPDVNQIVNSAITAHLKRALPKALEEALKPITEQLTALKTAPPPPDEGQAGKGKKEKDPEYAALAQKLADMQATLEKTEKARQEAETRSRKEKAFNDLKGALAPHVKPDMLDIAAKYLFNAENRVEFDDEGNALMRIRRSAGMGLPEEDELLPLADGVGFYVKSKEAAPFIPAPSGSGAAPMAKKPNQGMVPQRRQYDSPATSDDEKVRRAMEAEQRLAAKTGLK